MKVKSNILDVQRYNIGLDFLLNFIIFIEWESRQPGEHNIRPPTQEKIVNPRLLKIEICNALRYCSISFCVLASG